MKKIIKRYYIYYQDNSRTNYNHQFQMILSHFYMNKTKAYLNKKVQKFSKIFRVKIKLLLHLNLL